MWTCDSNEAVEIIWRCPIVCSSGLGSAVDGHFIVIVGSFCCHVLLHFPGAVTETPALPPQVVSPNMAVGESSSTQLYLVLGAVVGGLLFLVLLFLIVFICNRQRNNNNHSSQGEFILKITAVNTFYFYCHHDNLGLSFVRMRNAEFTVLNKCPFLYWVCAVSVILYYVVPGALEFKAGVQITGLWHSVFLLLIQFYEWGAFLNLCFVIFVFQCLTDASEHQDKFSDPALQLETVNVFGLNSKNLLNGCVTQNGFLHSNKLNITSNPLAETDEDKVKMFSILLYYLCIYNCLKIALCFELVIFLCSGTNYPLSSQSIFSTYHYSCGLQPHVIV